MTVDFHVHSTASDGTVSPSGLARATAGYRAAALTDHDNCDGVEEFLSAPFEPGPEGAMRVAGVELSIEPGEGFDKFHLLALGIDRTNAAFKALLAKILAGRNARNVRIVENFAKIGIRMECGTGRPCEDCEAPLRALAHGSRPC